MKSKPKDTTPPKPKQRSIWIDVLFKRNTAHHALHTGFLLNLSQKQLAEEADSRPDGRVELRSVALEALGSDSDETVAFALVVLSAVGQPADLTRAEKHLKHPSELVRRAARACRFQLRRLEK